MPATILLGTSSWTAEGWKGTFYPIGLPPAEQLTFYAERFPTVEIDSTFYGCPTPSTVQNWARRTPPDFIFAAKVPRSVTHEKVLVEAQEDVESFCKTMEALGPRLGPLLLQFPYFNRQAFTDDQAFMDRLRPFLERLPSHFTWALEIRNRTWLTDEFLDLLRKHSVALTLTDQPWMPGPRQYGPVNRLVTAPFSYVRWLGDRHKIEEQTTVWNRIIVDRTREMEGWAETFKEMMPYAPHVFVYVNNHYAGHAPESLRQFDTIWGGGLLTDPPSEQPASDQFDLGL